VNGDLTQCRRRGGIEHAGLRDVFVRFDGRLERRGGTIETADVEQMSNAAALEQKGTPYLAVSLRAVVRRSAPVRVLPARSMAL
jgi:hypothetical protein